MIYIAKIITKDNYKKYLLIDLSLIIVCLFLLVSYFSFAYYYNGLSLRFINAKVGNFLTRDSDLSIIIYAEKSNINKTGMSKYRIVSDVPELGYTFKEGSCKNGSLISYNEATKLINASVNLKDECSIYFDISKTADLSMHILVQENFGTDKYLETMKIPIYGYNFKNAICENGSNVTYNEDENSLYVTASQNDNCYVYFDINDNNIKANVYLNHNGTLELLDELDKSKNYTINSRSECRLNFQKINSTISYTNKKIEIITNDNAVCDVILDESE